MSRSQRHKRAIQGIDSRGVTSPTPKASSPLPGTKAPRVVTLPTKSGTATNGQTLTGVNGTFKGERITVTRQWVRFTGATGAVISGATGTTYVLQGADVGKTIKFRNIATSPYGVTTSDSTATATVS
jgi:hypothetical protein